MNKKEIGKKRIKEILGEKSEEIIRSFEMISPDFANYIVEFGYGDLYARAGLTDRERELAAVACLMGQNQTGTPLHAHLNGMLNVGWKKEEIIEVIILLVGYAGFPIAVAALGALKQVLQEKDELVCA